MTYILRFIDVAHPDQPDGLLIDLIYDYDEEDDPIVEDVRAYNIINGEVGQQVDISPVVKLAFTFKLLHILNNEIV